MSHDHSPWWRRTSVIILRPLLFLLLKRDWRGRQNIPRDGGVIIVANHLAMADPLVVAHFVYESGRYPVYLAKASLFTAKVVGSIMRKLGQIPVHRNTVDSAKALKAAEAALHAGECLIFYPEGTCTRDPHLWPMTGRTGAARLALTTGAKVIPVAHWGVQSLLPYGTKKFRPFPRKTMHVLAGPPIDLSEFAGRPITRTTLRAATDRIMRTIAELLGELRGAQPPEQLYDHRKMTQERRAAQQRTEREQAS